MIEVLTTSCQSQRREQENGEGEVTKEGLTLVNRLLHKE